MHRLAFGGAGPVHAARIVRDLGMAGMIVPLYPGVYSAIGLIMSDVRHDYVQSRLAPLGMVVSYGRLDGPPDPSFLAAMREHHATSPAVRFFTIHSFDDRPNIRAVTMRSLLDHLAAGRIRPLIYDRLPLAEAARAHELLESGKVIGKLLLKP